MKLSEALRLVNGPRQSPAKTFHLICGFTPLHLATFLQAHLQRRLPQASVSLDAGLYGDLCGNLSRVPADTAGVAIILEWFDLDPRLGERNSGAWNLADIAATVPASLERINLLLGALESRCSSVALAAPTLNPPPVFHTGTAEAAAALLGLEARMAGFLAQVGARGRTRIVSRQSLDASSPVGERHDLALHLDADFPYRRPHAGVLADHLAELLAPAPARKGLITDLDNTLWAGILGDAGVEGVSWSVEAHTRTHGLYQQLLSSLAAEGVLVAVATKNDPALVAQAFERPDILLRAEQVYPIAAGWGVKSESVSQILRSWNISASDVVFVDDSPMELEEVSRAHPEIECIPFPPTVADAGDFLRGLRNRFRRSVIRDEDRIRAASIRTNALFYTSEGRPADSFLETTNARLALDFTRDSGDGRALELVNKTNQFNLNGERYSPAEWKQLIERPGAFVMTVAYEDKFGSLGKIAVLAGTSQDDRLNVDVWVLSCRAFARRIEYRCLKTLFEMNAGASRIDFAFRETGRNGPLREFLSEFGCGASNPWIDRDRFEQNCPALPHSVTIDRSVVTHG